MRRDLLATGPRHEQLENPINGLRLRSRQRFVQRSVFSTEHRPNRAFEETRDHLPYFIVTASNETHRRRDRFVSMNFARNQSSDQRQQREADGRITDGRQ